MKRNTITVLILLCTLHFSTAQSKRELVQEIDGLKTKIQDTEVALAASRQENRIASAKLSAYETQISHLKQTNASLLSNLNGFLEASTKKSENIGSTLESLRQKEIQLRTISDAISHHDSLTLATLTNFKKVLGNELSMSLNHGALAISLPNAMIFGENTKNFKVSEKADMLLGKIASALKAQPELKIEVVSNSNAVETKENKLDNWEIGTQQAAAIAKVLQKKYQIDASRIQAKGKSELGFDSIETKTQIIIQPAFYNFFKLVKENLKN